MRGRLAVALLLAAAVGYLLRCEAQRRLVRLRDRCRSTSPRGLVLLPNMVQEQLRAAQVVAEEQLLHHVGSLFAAGEADEAALVGFYDAFSAVALPGFTKRWNASIACHSGRIQSLRHRDRWAAYHAPNMPDGTWDRPWPLGDFGTPANGVPVVYVLYDDTNAPCYVGSSEWLRGRLQQHDRDGKPFVRWTAYRCADREAAYELEDRLLGEFKPYLNKRAGR